MERKSKVTQDAVNATCDKLHADKQAATVNAVIAVTGGSFSTVGPMVKLWKEEQAKQAAPLPEMPEIVTKAMHKATADVWAAASALAGEEMARTQTEAEQAISEAKAELQEYTREVSRLENELEQAQKAATDAQVRVDDALGKVSGLTTEKTALETRLSDRDAELERIRADFEKLQSELIEIAKEKAKAIKPKNPA